ncbi:DNA replication and repair protein RecF [Nonlabens dokdonensis]|jgi:DNA replication and repair protein RecF|uniref:DNA replication and repair protein RecF n=2 Tax=Nonlabens dokdonensis TaxID=328515 RepID=L7WBI3_NONDD|nr:DNA replication/repair protein RecF [Nonlabens dokdonensis]AGC77572.1 DNA replication and repair protein [Nonlabens dokdonensis DSW-6]PZX39876.1 DNA replication and repair protein RecF [Nonlabens dokdonensis]
MKLDSISLINYKSFSSAEFEFDEKINCFVGNNGVGKTNVLDAIYHLAFAKSYFNPITVQNIKHDEDFFVVNGNFIKNDLEEKIVVSAKKGVKRVLKRNGKIYDKISDHIGLIPLVIISPADRDLITEGSDTRRKFLDGVISLSNSVYLNKLITYNKLLQQRNALLKYFYINRTFDSDGLAVYDEQLADLGGSIHETRTAFLQSFTPIFRKYYQQISRTEEVVDIFYKADFTNEDPTQVLKNARQKDLQLQYTSVGTHKDDLLFLLNDHPVKKYGSQGQQKSFLTALKLAQFEFIKQESGTVPILLLDDIFDKLDASRVAQIINMVNDEQFGQLFISDTHPERTEEVIKQTEQSYKIFKL